MEGAILGQEYKKNHLSSLRNKGLKERIKGDTIVDNMG